MPIPHRNLQCSYNFESKRAVELVHGGLGALKFLFLSGSYEPIVSPRPPIRISEFPGGDSGASWKQWSWIEPLALEKNELVAFSILKNNGPVAITDPDVIAKVFEGLFVRPLVFGGGITVTKLAEPLLQLLNGQTSHDPIAVGIVDQ